MTHRRDLDEMLRQWADHGADRLPMRYLEAALDEVATTPQRRAAPFVRTIPAKMRARLPAIGRAAAVAAAVVILGLAVYVALVGRNVGDPDATPTPPASSAASPATSAAAIPAPREVSVAARIDIGGRPTSIRASEDALWAAVGDRIVRIDPASGDVQVVVEVPDLDSACADCRPPGSWSFDVGEGSAWVIYHREDQSEVRRFDLATGALQASIQIGTAEGGGSGAEDVTVAFGSVWVVMCHSLTVARIDPATDQQIALVPLGLPPGGPCAATATIGAGPDAVWAGVARPTDGPASGVVVGIDPSSNEVIMTVRPASLPCGGVAADLGSVWVSACPDARQASIVRIDRAAGGSSTSIRLDGFAGDPVLREGLVWVPVVEASDPFGSGPGSVVAFDVQTGSATDAVRLGADVPLHGTTAAAALIAFDALWVTGDGGELVQISLAELDS